MPPLTAEQQGFREEVVGYLKQYRSPGWQDFDKDSEEYLRLGREMDLRLIEKGWYTMHWPGEYGGAGDVISHTILREAEGYLRVPTVGGHGRFIVGPALLQFGTEAQKAKYLPGIAKGDLVIAEGLTEPDAGSDLASLRMTAKPTGDGRTLRVNGTKIYVTYGHYANAMLLAARTDPEAPKRKGVSLFLIDMNLPGIEVRPLVCLTGHRVNEVVFHDVEIQEADLLGERNRGFYHMAAALNFERSGVDGPARYMADLEDLVEYCDQTGRLASAGVSETIGEIAARLHAWRAVAWRVAYLQQAGLDPSWEASVAELHRKWTNPRFGKLLLDVLGPESLISREDPASPLAGRLEWRLRESFNNHGQGGRMVTMNVIARRGVGLPKE